MTQAPGEDEQILPDNPQWYAWACIIAGPVLFIICGEYGGLIPATFACVFVSALGDREIILKHARSSDARLAVEVIRVIDGDTVEARVHLEVGRDLNTRIRLRGIDAPELKAACAQELRMAEAARCP